MLYIITIKLTYSNITQFKMFKKNYMYRPRAIHDIL